MTSTASKSPPVPREARALFGLRKEPGRLALRFMRMPLHAYAHDQGKLLGHAFVQFTHLGRSSGKTHESVAMVLHFDEATEEAVICAAWGPETDWYRNLQAHPATNVKLARLSFTPEQRFLSADEAVQIAIKFRAAHPHRLRLFSRLLALGDLDDEAGLREFVQTHPFIAFRPTPTS